MDAMARRTSGGRGSSRGGALRPFRLRTPLALLSAALLALRGARGQDAPEDCYPVQIDIFESEATCQGGSDPIAVGRLFADGTCRATEVSASDSTNVTYQFPGRYIARCSGTNLEISDSGCVNSDCSNPNGGAVCSREFTPASFYSRLSPPLYQLQPNDSLDYRFCMVLSDPDGNKIVFTLTGDCAAACGDRTAVPGGSSNATAPSATPAPSVAPASSVPATREPTFVPTPDATTAPPSLRPTAARASGSTDAPTDGAAPTASPNRGGSGNNDDGASAPTLRPSPRGTTRPPTAASGAVSPQTSNGNSDASTGIIVGSVVAGVCAVVVVLLIGFFLGVFRQRKIDAARSRDSSGAPSQDGQPLGHAGGSSPNIPAALASTTATARTPPMFESTQIIIPDHEDDVSTLGTPLGVSFLDETTTVGESSYKNHLSSSQLLLDVGVTGGAWRNRQPNQEEPSEERDRTATEDSEFLSESKAVCSDETSFEQAFDDDENEPPSGGGTGTAGEDGTVTDGSLHFIVTAPPGKLGMVIDDYINVTGKAPPPSAASKAATSSSSSGTPTVHALKDDSVLRRRGVRVGDLLETVDGVDVTELNCLDVSRMITGRSSAARVLGFARRKVTEC